MLCEIPPRRLRSNRARSAFEIGRVFENGMGLSNCFVASRNSAVVIWVHGLEVDFPCDLLFSVLDFFIVVASSEGVFLFRLDLLRG